MQTDSMEYMYTEVVVMGKAQATEREKDVQERVEQYQDILTNELGLTQLTRLGIDTGDSKPITQRLYNTTLSLRDKVDG